MEVDTPEVLLPEGLISTYPAVGQKWSRELKCVPCCMCSPLHLQASTSVQPKKEAGKATSRSAPAFCLFIWQSIATSGDVPHFPVVGACSCHIQDCGHNKLPGPRKIAGQGLTRLRVGNHNVLRAAVIGDANVVDQVASTQVPAAWAH